MSLKNRQQEKSGPRTIPAATRVRHFNRVCAVATMQKIQRIKENDEESTDDDGSSYKLSFGNNNKKKTKKHNSLANSTERNSSKSPYIFPINEEMLGKTLSSGRTTSYRNLKFDRELTTPTVDIVSEKSNHVQSSTQNNQILSQDTTDKLDQNIDFGDSLLHKIDGYDVLIDNIIKSKFEGNYSIEDFLSRVSLPKDGKGHKTVHIQDREWLSVVRLSVALSANSHCLSDQDTEDLPLSEVDWTAHRIWKCIMSFQTKGLFATENGGVFRKTTNHSWLAFCVGEHCKTIFKDTMENGHNSATINEDSLEKCSCLLKHITPKAYRTSYKNLRFTEKKDSICSFLPSNSVINQQSFLPLVVPFAIAFQNLFAINPKIATKSEMAPDFIEWRKRWINLSGQGKMCSSTLSLIVVKHSNMGKKQLKGIKNDPHELGFLIVPTAIVIAIQYRENEQIRSSSTLSSDSNDSNSGSELDTNSKLRQLYSQYSDLVQKFDVEWKLASSIHISKGVLTRQFQPPPSMVFLDEPKFNYDKLPLFTNQSPNSAFRIVPPELYCLVSQHFFEFIRRRTFEARLHGKRPYCDCKPFIYRRYYLNEMNEPYNHVTRDGKCSKNCLSPKKTTKFDSKKPTKNIEIQEKTNVIVDAPYQEEPEDSALEENEEEHLISIDTTIEKEKTHQKKSQTNTKIIAQTGSNDEGGHEDVEENDEEQYEEDYNIHGGDDLEELITTVTTIDLTSEDFTVNSNLVNPVTSNYVDSDLDDSVEEEVEEKKEAEDCNMEQENNEEEEEEELKEGEGEGENEEKEREEEEGEEEEEEKEESYTQEAISQRRDELVILKLQKEKELEEQKAKRQQKILESTKNKKRRDKQKPKKMPKKRPMEANIDNISYNSENVRGRDSVTAGKCLSLLRNSQEFSDQRPAKLPKKHIGDVSANGSKSLERMVSLSEISEIIRNEIRSLLIPEIKVLREGVKEMRKLQEELKGPKSEVKTPINTNQPDVNHAALTKNMSEMHESVCLMAGQLDEISSASNLNQEIKDLLETLTGITTRQNELVTDWVEKISAGIVNRDNAIRRDLEDSNRRFPLSSSTSSGISNYDTNTSNTTTTTTTTTTKNLSTSSSSRIPISTSGSITKKSNTGFDSEKGQRLDSDLGSRKSRKIRGSNTKSRELTKPKSTNKRGINSSNPDTTVRSNNTTTTTSTTTNNISYLQHPSGYSTVPVTPGAMNSVHNFTPYMPLNHCLPNFGTTQNNGLMSSNLLTHPNQIPPSYPISAPPPPSIIVTTKPALLNPSFPLHDNNSNNSNDNKEKNGNNNNNNNSNNIQCTTSTTAQNNTNFAFNSPICNPDTLRPNNIHDSNRKLHTFTLGVDNVVPISCISPMDNAENIFSCDDENQDHHMYSTGGVFDEEFSGLPTCTWGHFT